MAIKKSEIYSSLDASCDKLRGGMDPSQYKNYILSLLFMKYVTVKFKGKPYPQVTVPEGGSFDDLKALRNQDNIGEGVDKAFAKLSEANDQLSGIFRDVHFNDYTKLGKGKEMVKKITDLIDIFCRPEFDLEKNRAGGDDLLGDTYEYLMRKFAVESGKSKGQFLTPAEASRVLAGVLGIADVKARSEGWSIYDPACGSGSLLIRAADAAQCPVGIFGQEKDVTTAGLAKMNLVLHNKATGTIKTGNTFSEPQYLDTENGKTTVKRFDFAVVNPPFSLKNWKDGYKDLGRMEGFGATPPDKNGDYAWLMHVIKSLKQNGRAAVILPLGVLSRGKAEEAIRKNIVDRGLIEGIIIFPPNIFFGTGIPACVLVLSKIGAGTRAGIFMVDASGGFVKDKDKNRLRERDIEKIVSTYKYRREEPHYSRFVQWGEIKVKNAYNLNMPRYITSGVKEDVQDLDAHMNGGIPSADIDGLDAFWTAFPHLRRRLFAVDRKGYETPKVGLDEVREAIQSDKEFVAYAEKVAAALTAWEKAVEGTFSSIAKGSNPKKFIRTPAQKLMEAFAELKLLDVFDVYEVLLSYWNATMADDVYVISDVGYAAGREIEEITRESENKKTGDMKKTVVGWDGKIIPRSLLDKTYFAKEAQAVADAETKSATAKAAFEEFVGAATGEDGALSEYLGLDGKLDTKRLAKDAKKAKADGAVVFGAYSAAGAFAAASTGTAIAGLSGAAATNATLAFFGGGALAAGGLGMAGGMAVLGGIVAGPALAIMGAVMGAKASENLDNARSNLAKVKEAEAEVNVMVTACNAITRRADLFTQVLIKLEALMFPQLYSFESIIDMEGCDFAKYRPESKKRVAALLSTAQAVKAILDTALLDDKGALTSKSEDVLLETNKYLKRAAA